MPAPRARLLETLLLPWHLRMWIRSFMLGGVLAAWVPAGLAAAIEIPAEAACPPFPIDAGPGEIQAEEDVVPSPFKPGTRLDLEEIDVLRNYLPREVWERRNTFFFEGMQLELGPCYRRYPAAPFFEQATREHAGQARLDADGNLLEYAGTGLPFPPDTIDEAAPDAGWKWAWNYRYRYQGAGFRGPFRIIHIRRRGRSSERFEGDIFLLPRHGFPGSEDATGKSFASGGAFKKPTLAKGIKWRQFRSRDADTAYSLPDEVFLWIPQIRRVRRSPPTGIEGLFMPSYTRGRKADTGQGVIPTGNLENIQVIQTPDVSISTAEHWRRGFVGLVIRPNAYRFKLLRVQDVIAPINSNRPGFPTNPNRSYGSSGLSLASDRWEVRRAVVIGGKAKDPGDQSVGSVKLWIDVLTLQPLYYVSHRPNGLIREVGIFMGRYTGDDLTSPNWDGAGQDFGVIQPVAQTFWVTGDNGWLRESFKLRSDPPSSSERRSFTTTHRLQRKK
ncbi:MAG: DUF1329 domain-containing protein [Myxococcales bacterium]|nr:DUF1329 domain-containing protein [Myxococcales bacterium]